MKNRNEVIAAILGVVAGIVLLSVLGAGTVDPNGHFLGLTLGGHTNVVSDDNVDLTYNGAHYQRSVPILNNLTNGVGTNLTSLLSSAVQAGQTNETAASITNKLGGFSGATGSYLGADGLFHTVTSGQTNDGTGGWTLSGTTNWTSNWVGVNTATPQYALAVNTAGNATGFSVGSVSGATGKRVQVGFLQDLGYGYIDAENYGVALAPFAINPYGGAVGIGQAPGAEQLEVTGGIKSTTTNTVADIRFTGTTTVGIRLKSLTTAQKNALTPAAGDMVFDSDLGRFQAYDGSAWHSRVRLDGDTMTGILTAPGFDYTAPATLTPTDAGVSIDFGAANRLATCTLTGAVTFAFANQTAGRRYELFIMGCSTNSPITWPTVSGVFPAGAYPSVAAAGKWHHLKFTCITSSVTTNIYIDGSTSN